MTPQIYSLLYIRISEQFDPCSYFPMVVWSVSVGELCGQHASPFMQSNPIMPHSKMRYFLLFPRNAFTPAQAYELLRLAQNGFTPCMERKHRVHSLLFVHKRAIFLIQPLILGLTLLISLFLRTRIACPSE